MENQIITTTTEITTTTTEITTTTTEITTTKKSRKPYKARTYNTGINSVNINFTKAVAAFFRPGERALVVIENGALVFKPTNRDDAGCVNCAINIKPCGAGRFRLNQHMITKLIKVFGVDAVKSALHIGDDVGVSHGKHRWLSPTGESNPLFRYTIAKFK